MPEYDALLDAADPGLAPHLGFDPAEDVAAPFIGTGARPRVAILREQGVNSHLETAHAFDRAGFDAYDVHMSDLLSGRASLADYAGAVACGGFSYGDVLGAGEGLGEDDPLQCATGGYVRRVLRSCGYVRAGDLQRLPDDEQPCIDHPGRRGVAEVHAQTGRRNSRRVFRWSKWRSRRRFSSRAWKARGFPSPLRTAKASPIFSQQGDAGRVDIAMRFVDHRGDATERYPFNPEWIATRRDVGDDPGWPLYGADAAYGTRPSQRADELAPGQLGRGRQPVDAGVPECAPLGGVGIPVRCRKAKKAARGRLFHRSNAITKPY